MSYITKWVIINPGANKELKNTGEKYESTVQEEMCAVIKIDQFTA